MNRRITQILLLLALWALPAIAGYNAKLLKVDADKRTALIGESIKFTASLQQGGDSGEVFVMLPAAEVTNQYTTPRVDAALSMSFDAHPWNTTGEQPGHYHPQAQFVDADGIVLATARCAVTLIELSAWPDSEPFVAQDGTHYELPEASVPWTENTPTGSIIRVRIAAPISAEGAFEWSGDYGATLLAESGEIQLSFNRHAPYAVEITRLVDEEGAQETKEYRQYSLGCPAATIHEAVSPAPKVDRYKGYPKPTADLILVSTAAHPVNDNHYLTAARRMWPNHVKMSDINSLVQAVNAKKQATPWAFSVLVVDHGTTNLQAVGCGTGGQWANATPRLPMPADLAMGTTDKWRNYLGVNYETSTDSFASACKGAVDHITLMGCQVAITDGALAIRISAGALTDVTAATNWTRIVPAENKVYIKTESGKFRTWRAFPPPN